MLFSYGKSHVSSLVCCLLAAAIPALLAYVAGMSLDFCLLCMLLVLMMLAIAGAVNYLRVASFLRSLERIAQQTKDVPAAHAAIELLERPDFYEGELAYNALRTIVLGSQRQTAEAQAQMNQYRDYIETWVHEIKTPLAAARLMLQNEPTSYARGLQAELSRTEELAEQALYLARSTSVEKDYVICQTSLTTVVNTAIKSRMHTLIAAGMHVDTSDVVAQDLQVACDSKWLVFIIGQLIDNVVRYRKEQSQSADMQEAATQSASAQGASTQDASAQDAGAQNSTCAPTVRFSARICNDNTAYERIDLHIWDNGCGIAPEDISRVFDRGFTGQNGRKHARSTGIGLYLVAQLCCKMGQTVTLTSLQGEWTDVCIGLPNLQK